MPIDVTPPEIAEDFGHAFPGQLLLAEYIHRSANDFAAACAEVHVAGRETSLERTRSRLGVVFQRLVALAEIQRLLQPPREPVMDLGSGLSALCRLHAEARFAAQGVFVQLRAVDVTIDAGRGWALLAIVSELLTNAARHAFKGVGGLVTVEISAFDDQLLCIVSDDGIGMARAPSEGGGGAIVMQLARSAGIEVTRHLRGAGASIELRMPATETGARYPKG